MKLPTGCASIKPRPWCKGEFVPTNDSRRAVRYASGDSFAVGTQAVVAWIRAALCGHSRVEQNAAQSAESKTMNQIDQQKIWDAFNENVSPLDENFEVLSQFVRDGIADGTLTAPGGIPGLLEKHRRVMAIHHQIAEREGTMPATAEGEPSIYDNIKPMKASL